MRVWEWGSTRGTGRGSEREQEQRQGLLNRKKLLGRGVVRGCTVRGRGCGSVAAAICHFTQFLLLLHFSDPLCLSQPQQQQQ